MLVLVVIARENFDSGHFELFNFPGRWLLRPAFLASIKPCDVHVLCIRSIKLNRSQWLPHTNRARTVAQTSLAFRVYSQHVFLDKFPFWQVLFLVCTNIYPCMQWLLDSLYKRKHGISRVKAAFCLPKPIVFLVHLSSFPWRPYTRTNFPCPKAGMTSFGTRLLGKEKLSIFYRPHEQI